MAKASKTGAKAPTKPKAKAAAKSAEKATAKPRAKAPAAGTANTLVSFRREMDRLFDDFFGRGAAFMPRWSFPDLNGDLVPEIEVKETKKQMVLTAELPGMDQEDIDVSVSDGMMTVKGEKKMETSEEKEDYRVSERRYGSFQRSFTLPASIDADAIKASFDRGVLKVTMPKKAEAKNAAKKVKVG